MWQNLISQQHFRRKLTYLSFQIQTLCEICSRHNGTWKTFQKLLDRHVPAGAEQMINCQRFTPLSLPRSVIFQDSLVFHWCPVLLGMEWHCARRLSCLKTGHSPTGHEITQLLELQSYLCCTCQVPSARYSYIFFLLNVLSFAEKLVLHASS